jgi:hypothetical protein
MLILARELMLFERKENLEEIFLNGLPAARLPVRPSARPTTVVVGEEEEEEEEEESLGSAPQKTLIDFFCSFSFLLPVTGRPIDVL